MKKIFGMNIIIKQFFFRFALYLAIVQPAIVLGVILGNLSFDIYSLLRFKYTYIAEIDTPTYGQYTKDILQEFNSMGDNKIISFSEIKNGRPVYIYEMSDEIKKLRPFVLGMAYPQYEQCTIYIAKNLDWLTFRETLLHEYLHCMGYDHSADKYDLMYYQDILVDKEQNIRQYAKKVKERYYE